MKISFEAETVEHVAEQARNFADSILSADVKSEAQPSAKAKAPVTKKTAKKKAKRKPKTKTAAATKASRENVKVAQAAHAENVEKRKKQAKEDHLNEPLNAEADGDADPFADMSDLLSSDSAFVPPAEPSDEDLRKITTACIKSDKKDLLITRIKSHQNASGEPCASLAEITDEDRPVFYAYCLKLIDGRDPEEVIALAAAS